MLVLEVAWLTSAYEAEINGEAEWPPHPARAFGALVSVADPGSEDDAALRWLESLSPPMVSAPVAVSSERQAFVITNAEESKDKHQSHLGRTSGSRDWRRSLPASPVVRMMWPDADPPIDVANRLDQLARRVPYLGRSTSPALLSFHIRLPDNSEDLDTYSPDPSGRHRLRVPHPGYLDELRAAFQDTLLDRPRARVISYRCSTDPSVAAPEVAHPASWPHLVTLGFDPGSEVDGRHAMKVAAAFKAALLSRLGKPIAGDDWAPLSPKSMELLHGHYSHAAEPRRRQCAVMALPFVNHGHASGNILGVGLAISPHLETEVLGPLLRLLGLDRPPAEGPRLNTLQVGSLGRLVLRRADGRSTVSSRRWTQPAKQWDTVLPIVLERYPRRGYTLVDAVADGCLWAGLERPVEVDLHPVSPVPGAPHLIWSQMRHSDGPPRPAVHASLHFARPVHGPVLVGHMRHLGLGLCLPSASQSRAS